MSLIQEHCSSQSIIGAVVEERTVGVILLVDDRLAHDDGIEDRELVPHHILAACMVVSPDVIILWPHVEQRIQVEIPAAPHDGLLAGCRLSTADVHHLLWQGPKPLWHMHPTSYDSATRLGSVLIATLVDGYMESPTLQKSVRPAV